MIINKQSRFAARWKYYSNWIALMMWAIKAKWQGIHLREWKDAVLAELFANKILPIDAETTQICAKRHIPDHVPENDAWIASSAIQHNLILVTRNVADFEGTGAKVFNPFEQTTE